MSSCVRWAGACFLFVLFVAACTLSEGTDPSKLSDASAGDGALCEPSTCPGTDNECGQRTCVNGACAMAFLPAGTVTSVQVPGDCHKSTCDGQGGFASQIDDLDLPDNQNPCTKGACTNGVPSNPPGPAGVSCGGAGLVCNSNGQCVGCLKALDCPGTDSECGTRTCSSVGVCGNTFAAAGTALSTQVAGDCHVLQCDGNGAAVSAVDNADVPVDGNACTSDTCVLGTPSNPSTAAGTACNVNGKTLCNGAGVCVECLLPTTCPGSDSFCSSRTCTAGACGTSNTAAGTATPTQIGGDCHENRCDGAGGVTNAVNDADVPVDGNACTSDVCTNGTPSNPSTAAGTACNVNGKTLCDGAGACVECLLPATCPGSDTFCGSRTCTAGACGMSSTAAGTPTPTQVSGDCHENRCDGAGGVTNAVNDADVPVDGNACTSDVCTSGTPTNPATAAGTACNVNGKTLCDGAGVCVECLDATTCPGTDTFCGSRTCTAGVCGTSNAAAGTPTPTQTAGDCHENRCDGAGGVTNAVNDLDVPIDGIECTDDVCTSGTPSNPNSSIVTVCSIGGTHCDGNGACVP